MACVRWVLSTELTKEKGSNVLEETIILEFIGGGEFARISAQPGWVREHLELLDEDTSLLFAQGGHIMELRQEPGESTYALVLWQFENFLAVLAGITSLGDGSAWYEDVAYLAMGKETPELALQSIPHFM